MLRTIMVSLGLAAGFAFAACDNGEDGDATTAATSDTDGEDDDNEDDEGEEEEDSSESSAEGSTSGDDTTTSGTPDTTTGGGDECTEADECQTDDDCAGGGACVVCSCVGGTDDTSDPANSDYGPCPMGCPAGEMALGFEGIDACVCAPTCDGMGATCPAPNEGTASAMCVLVTMMGAPPSHCALVCTDSTMCPTGAECFEVGGGSICMHPTPA